MPDCAVHMKPSEWLVVLALFGLRSAVGRRRPCAQVVRVCKLIFLKVYFADMKMRIIQNCHGL